MHALRTPDARFADLPDNARRYIARIEELTGVPAAIISTGSDRDDTILRDDIALPMAAMA